MKNLEMQDYGLTPLTHVESKNIDGGELPSQRMEVNLGHELWDFCRGVWDGIVGRKM